MWLTLEGPCINPQQKTWPQRPLEGQNNSIGRRLDVHYGAAVSERLAPSRENILKV